MDIQVYEDNTGYAPKSCRYHAIDADSYDGAEDSKNRSTIGYGATREAAIQDLIEIMLDEGEITEAEAKRYMRKPLTREQIQDEMIEAELRGDMIALARFSAML